MFKYLYNPCSTNRTNDIAIIGTPKLPKIKKGFSFFFLCKNPKEKLKP